MADAQRALREAARLRYQRDRAAKDQRVMKALLTEDQRALVNHAVVGEDADRLREAVERRRDQLTVVKALGAAANASEGLLGGNAANAVIESALHGSDLYAVAKDRYVDDGAAAAKSHRAERPATASGPPSAAGDSRWALDKLGGIGDPARANAAARDVDLIVTEKQIAAHIEVSDFQQEKTAAEFREERSNLQVAKRHLIDLQRANLPVTKAKAAVLAAIEAHQVVVVIGETGSGKTTQIPQFLLEAGYSKVVCTQPRRLAAMSVAERVATEMNVRCGQLVGYRVRFDDKVSERTEIEFATDGMMLKTLSGDPQLSEYKAIMIDEAHERSLATDILMGVLRDLIRSRKDLKLIVASATIQADKFIKFFGDERTPLVRIEGRTFPVQTYYIPDPVEDYVLEAAKCALQTHLDEPLPGDILVFMPGQEDIESCINKLKEALESMAAGTVRPVLLLPLYSTLPADEQKLIYQTAPQNTRKIIVSTNIAETSITVDGVAYVIDTGLCKMKYYDTRANMECLSVVPISTASAEQRKGRAGRTRAGQCFRLYTKFMYENELERDPVPEILRSNLTAIILNLKYLGIDNPLHFDFIDAPSSDAVIKAFNQLRYLGALTERGELSKLGRRMAELPVDPALAKALVRSQEVHGCCKQTCIAVSMLSLQNSVFVHGRDNEKMIEAVKKEHFHGTTGDVTGFVNVFREWEENQRYDKKWCDRNAINYNALLRGKDVRNQLLNAMHKMFPEEITSCDDPLQLPTAVTKSLLSGCFLNVAKLSLDDRTYVVPKARTEAFVFPGSCLGPLLRFQGPPMPGAPPPPDPPRFANVKSGQRPQLVMFAELRQLREKAYMVHVSVITPEWVNDVVPGFFKPSELTNDVAVKKSAAA